MKVTNTAGRCIYCPNTPEQSAGGRLSEEHIVPYALSGEWTIADASCSDCAKVTSRFEGEVLRICWQAERAAFGLKSRRKKDIPASFPVSVQSESEELTTEAAPGERPAIVLLPVFTAPGANPDGVEMIDVVPINLLDATEKAFLLAQQTVAPDVIGSGVTRTVEVDFRVRPLPFARLLAKIGHALAVAQFGITAFEQTYLADFIRGITDNAGEWLGSSTGDHTPLDALHTYAIVETGGEVRVYLRLFASFGGPEYVLIVGRLRAAA